MPLTRMTLNTKDQTLNTRYQDSDTSGTGLTLDIRLPHATPILRLYYSEPRSRTLRSATPTHSQAMS